MIRKKICENTILQVEGNQKNIDILNEALVSGLPDHAKLVATISKKTKQRNDRSN